MVSCDRSNEWQALKEELEELDDILPVNALSDVDVPKGKVVERITSGSASMIYFFGHGSSKSKSSGRTMTPFLYLAIIKSPRC